MDTKRRIYIHDTGIPIKKHLRFSFHFDTVADSIFMVSIGLKYNLVFDFTFSMSVNLNCTYAAAHSPSLTLNSTGT